MTEAIDERPGGDLDGTAAIDPRVQRTRDAVVTAVLALLAEDGAPGITHQRVAERAGVGRATVYRHWPQTVDLLIDALGDADEPFLRRSTGPLREWMIDEVCRVSADMAHPLSAQAAAAMLTHAQLGPEATEYRDRVLQRAAAPLADAIDVAMATGELASRPDPDEVLARVIGPALFRVQLQGRSVDRRFATAVVDAALSEHLARDGHG